LILFLGSFGLYTFITFDSVSSLQGPAGLSIQAVHKSDPMGTGAGLQQLSEEAKTEVESNLDISPIILPFSASHLQIQFISAKHFPKRPSKRLTAEPIYLSACNFRI